MLTTFKANSKRKLQVLNLA